MFCLWQAGIAGALERFVAQDGQAPEWPYTNWSSAASNIQDALNVASNGDTVWVGDGVYYAPTNAYTNANSTNVVYLTKALTLRSLNGPDAAIINGGGSNRCVYMYLPTDACLYGPAIIDGLTLTNGLAFHSGAGIYMSGQTTGTGIVQNCTIAGNVLQLESAASYSGGAGLYIYNTTFIPVISNCLVRGNRTIPGSQGSASGAGSWMRSNGLVVDCVFVENNSAGGSGGMYFSSPWTTVDRCIIISNTCVVSGSGAYNHGGGGELRNSLIAYNSGSYSVYGYNGLRMFNCTVISNSLGVYARSTVTSGDVRNNIMQSMAISAGAVITGYNNCLPSIPTIGEWNDTLVTTNNPAYIGFVDAAAGDYRLRPDAPCVNAGVNQPDWLAGAQDLDRRRRIDRFSGAADIGCYEHTPAGLMFQIR